MGRVIDLTTDTCCQKHKHGSHLLAFAFDDVIGDVIEQFHPTLHEIPKFLLKYEHFGFNRFLYLLEVWFHPDLMA